MALIIIIIIIIIIINHILSECKMLAPKEYKRRHDNIARLVHSVVSLT